jgi:hypothetical protein
MVIRPPTSQKWEINDVLNMEKNNQQDKIRIKLKYAQFYLKHYDSLMD